MVTQLSSSKGCASAPDEDDMSDIEAAVRRIAATDDAPARCAFIVRVLDRFPADAALPPLKDESERYLTIDPHVALRLAETLAFAGGYAGRPEYRALGLMALGDVYKELGRYRESVGAMDEAGRLFLAHGDEVGWARTRIGWVVSMHRLGRGEQAVAAVGQARGVLVAHLSWFRVATLDLNTGSVYYDLGLYDEAQECYTRARTVYESLGKAGEIRAAFAEMNQAILLTQRGDFRAAMRLHEHARETYVAHRATSSIRKQEHNVAFVYAAQGKYTLALRRLTALLAEYDENSLHASAAWVALDVVECYLHLNRVVEALHLAEETVIRFEACGTPTEIAKAHFLAAHAHTRLGNIEQALPLLDVAARAFAAGGLVVRLALVTLQRAALHLQTGDWHTAMHEAEQARVLLSERGLVVRQAQADLIRARAAVGLGDDAGAVRFALAALAVSREHDAEWLAHESHRILGDVARLRGDNDASIASYEEAMASIERVQSTLAVELRTHFLADKVGVYETAIAVSLRLAQPARAFGYLERMKSRALVDYLAGNLEVQVRARDGASDELLATLARLREEHHGLYNRLYGYGLTARDDATLVRDDAALRAAVREREKEITRLLERLALDRTEGVHVPTLDAEAAFAVPAVEAGTVLLEYFFGADDGAVFVVTRSGLTVTPLAVRPREIARLLQRWYLNLTATAQAVARGASPDALGRNARGILAALYRALVAPVAAHLGGCTRLVVIPYGPTHAVPFHALHDGERYLLETMEVSSCPSSSLLRLCAERPHRDEDSTLVLGCTGEGRLPEVCKEAQAVSALMPGICHIEDAATRDALIEAAPHHRVIHLAAHGEARLDNPAFAHLALADGHLTTTDVFNLRLHGALVTLSGCETGRATVTGGDELIGLSRGFLHAGASTLVQSLWRVEDGTTATLMAAFYRALRAGQPKGAALRIAQRALLATHGVHPFYWAPFQLVGDAGPL